MGILMLELAVLEITSNVKRDAKEYQKYFDTLENFISSKVANCLCSSGSDAAGNSIFKLYV